MVAVSVALQLLVGLNCRAAEESVPGREQAAAVQEAASHPSGEGHSDRHSPASHGSHAKHAECPQSFLIGASTEPSPTVRRDSLASAPDEAPTSPDYDVPAPIPIARA